MIPIFSPTFGAAERENLLECIDTGWISSQGRFIGEFEAAFAKRSDMPFGIATSNCTTALHLSLAALGVGPGDEVICTDLTFIAPVNMIAHTGARPVLVDVDPVSWAMSPEQTAQAVTERTKAIIVVHPFSHAADMDPIMAIAAQHGIAVIEDVAEAPFGEYKNRKLGSFGDMSCFSFFANKVMTSGEGGMVLCRDPKLDEKLRVFRDHGMSREKRYHHIVAGYNYRMTNMQAAVGLAQLADIDRILERRASQIASYRTAFARNPSIQVRSVEPWCKEVHWMTTISLPDAGLRGPLLKHLKSQGIDSRQMVFPVHEAVPYQDAFDPNAFPVASGISHRSLHLPSSTELSDSEIGHIAEVVHAWAEAHF